MKKADFDAVVRNTPELRARFRLKKANDWQRKRILGMKISIRMPGVMPSGEIRR